VVAPSVEGTNEGIGPRLFSRKDRERKLPGAARPRWVGRELN